MTDSLKMEALENRIQLLERELAQARLEQVAHESQRIELVSILTNAPLAVMVVDEQRRVQKFSQALLQTLGRTEAEVLGMRGGEALRCVHHLDDPQGCGYGSSCKKLQDSTSRPRHNRYREEPSQGSGHGTDP